jgi:hypothetical protein
MRKRFYISFVEEGIFNPKYAGYTGGRVEIHTQEEPYALDEIRFLTPRTEEWFAFREAWDLKDVNSKRLAWLIQQLKERFYERVSDKKEGPGYP